MVRDYAACLLAEGKIPHDRQWSTRSKLDLRGERNHVHGCCPPSRTAARMIRHLAARKLKGKRRLTASSRHMKAAYKQLPRDRKQATLAIIVVYDSTMGRWRFEISKALLFGLSGAVLNFNRVPFFIVAMARRWLGIVCHSSSMVLGSSTLRTQTSRR